MLYLLRDWPPTSDILGIKIRLLARICFDYKKQETTKKKGNGILDFSSVPHSMIIVQMVDFC